MNTTQRQDGKNFEAPAEGTTPPKITSILPDQSGPMSGGGDRTAEIVLEVSPDPTGPATATPTAAATKWSIPSDINNRSRLEAASFYVTQLGWAIHPLNASDQGNESERGKKPVLKGWPTHTVGDIAPGFLEEHFGGGSNHNLGCVVRPPFVHVDLDSKPDAGASVQEWLSGMSDLGAVPRERTGGGAHLVFVCLDLPAEVLKQKQALAKQINDRVSAELYFSGLNLVMSPSVHKSGHAYRWEVTGDIPTVKWVDLCRWFGFVAPETKKRGRPAKEKPWWATYPEDLTTLSLCGVMDDLGLRGKCLDKREEKWAVRCPWADEHSSGNASSTPQSDTVIFNLPGRMPAFKCLHAHCTERDVRHVLAFAEVKKPGVVAARCTRRRAWSPDATDDFGRAQLVLPGRGKPVGQFARRLGKEMAKCKQLFRFGSKVVEIICEEGGDPSGCSFSTIQPKEFVTAIEGCVEVGHVHKDEAVDEIFIAESIQESTARVVLSSRDFQNELPVIRRVLNVPIPMLDDAGELVTPSRRYDSRFQTWLHPEAPEIETMPLADALALLDDLLSGPKNGGFWWRDEEAKTLALARLLTPYCKGLIKFKRSPLWLFNGNRPGTGKDTCAGLALVLYTGRAVSGAPISKDNEEEMRKRITTTILSGSPFLHFANVKGEISNGPLEAATDNSGVWEDRKLGSNTEVKLPNELDVSLSSNGATWSEDFQRRARVIELHCGLEDLSGHQYRHADMFELVSENRSKILSALHALVVHWDQQGRPNGHTPFSSFPQWGAVVGGIFASCGLPDPCQPQLQGIASGDHATQAMGEFFGLVSEHFGSKDVRKEVFQKFIKENAAVHELFDRLDFNTPGGLASFAKLLLKYNDRELGGVTFTYVGSSRNHGIYHFRSSNLEKSPPSPSPVVPAEVSSVVTTAERSLDASSAGNEGDQGLLPAGVTHLKLNSDVPLTAPNYSSLPDDGWKKSLRVPIRTMRCTAVAHLNPMVADLINSKVVAMVMEFPTKHRDTDTHPPSHPHWLVLYQPGGDLWRIDCEKLKDQPMLGHALRLSLLHKTIVAHDAKPILRWLHKTFGFMPADVRCTRTAARVLLNGSGSQDDDLGACIQRHLPIGNESGTGMSGRFTLTTPSDHSSRQGGDEEHLHELLAALEKELKTADLERTWELENAVLPAFATMEANGMHVDPALLLPLVLKGDVQAKVLFKHVDRATHRIHSSFDPLGTVTGRATSKNPPLQNVKRGSFREVFSAPEGCCLVMGDYANIDLRVVAAESGDETMLAAFSRGEDLHLNTAAAVFGKQLVDVTPQERQLAKAFNLCGRRFESRMIWAV